MRRLLPLAILATAPFHAQPPTTLRTETRVVQIDVEVTDSHGRPVPGLTREDFTVTDAGKPRSIQIFSVSSDAQLTPPPSASPLPPSVFSNRVPAARPSAHSTVILLDAINNYWDDFASARLRLLKMVDQLRKEERIAIYAATTRPAGITVVQDFTTDRQTLRRTLQAYSPPPIKPAPGLGTGIPTPPIEMEMLRRTAVFDTMSDFRLLADHLAKFPGRKSVLWLTSGLPPKELRDLPDVYDKAAAALNESNIAVNVVDDDGVGDLARRWGRSATWTLRYLADSTGGKLYSGRNDLENMLTEAIETPRITYTLGFYLPDGERDNKFHALAVRTARPKLTLNYRKGYYAGVVAPPTAPKKREPLENALLDPQDVTEIDITAQVHRTPGKLVISLKLGLAQLSLTEEAERLSGKIETMFLETNAAGQLVGRVSDTKTFRMSPSLRNRLEAEGVPITQELRLPETAVRLLIVIRDATSGRTGSLSVPL